MEGGQDGSQPHGSCARQVLLCGTGVDPEVLNQTFSRCVDMQFAHRVDFETLKLAVDDPHSFFGLSLCQPAVETDLNGGCHGINANGVRDHSAGVGVCSLLGRVIGVFHPPVKCRWVFACRFFSKNHGKRVQGWFIGTGSHV